MDVYIYTDIFPRFLQHFFTLSYEIVKDFWFCVFVKLGKTKLYFGDFNPKVTHCVTAKRYFTTKYSPYNIL